MNNGEAIRPKNVGESSQVLFSVFIPACAGKVLALIAVLLPGFFNDTPAGEIASDPSGIYRVALLGNSDTRLSIPFSRPKAAAGLVQSISDGVITLQGAPGWTTDQFVYSSGVQSNTYFVLIRSGSREGEHHTITANTADAITVDLNGDTLTGVNAGDRIEIVPYWTLGTLFLGGAGIHISPSPGSRSSEVLMPDLEGIGINLSAARTYYFWSGAWRQVGQGTANLSDDVLLPDAYVIVRHNIADSTTLLCNGVVWMGKLAVPLAVQAASKQDNFVALARPTAISLNDSGLISSGAFSASPSPGARTDELFVFDDTVVGKNKAASATYYYWSGAWRKVGSGSTDVGTDEVFQPGTGMVIRKGNGTGTAVWLNATTY